ncbi:hypothetical protein WMY93_007408 [Mugilogobius chulae]|uniref:Fibronectin type-III domain-containing protein n=1 Tax=Mugilogobius chulae TaxID=88201 RepID=A0AAW0PCV2_9GOBI
MYPFPPLPSPPPPLDQSRASCGSCMVPMMSTPLGNRSPEEQREKLLEMVLVIGETSLDYECNIESPRESKPGPFVKIFHWKTFYWAFLRSKARIGEPTAPKLEVKVHNKGNALKVNWFKQDDGGSPIKHYLVRYKAKHTSDWKPEIRLPHGSEYVVLSGLDWNTEYEVHVVAENQQGKSQPGVLSFRTASEPTTVPEDNSGLGTGAIVGS